MVFNVTIRVKGEAFTEDRDGEIVRVLREIAGEMKQGTTCGACFDANGHKVGYYGFEDERSTMRG